jgi:hypothetical protein
MQEVEQRQEQLPRDAEDAEKIIYRISPQRRKGRKGRKGRKEKIEINIKSIVISAWRKIPSNGISVMNKFPP